MSIERLKQMKEALMCAAEPQMYHLDEVDAEELGEVIDMIKDIEEAIYYRSVVKAMEESEYTGRWDEHEPKYYTPMPHNGRMYYGDRMYYSNSNSGSNNSGSSDGRSSNGSQYSEREFPGAFQDERDGKSYRSRRMYMEAKETKQDKTVQMKELERYTQELTQDIVDMIKDASPEERQYLSKKMTALASKVTQLNDQR